LTENRSPGVSTDERSEGRAFLQGIAAMVAGLIALVVVLGLGIAGFSVYLDRSAQKNAREFCDAVALGSKASLAASRARSLKVMTVGGSDEIDFYFPSVPFSVVECHVTKAHDGTVMTKEVIIAND
jgi:hypothetical protein